MKRRSLVTAVGAALCYVGAVSSFCHHHICVTKTTQEKTMMTSHRTNVVSSGSSYRYYSQCGNNCHGHGGGTTMVFAGERLKTKKVRWNHHDVPNWNHPSLIDDGAAGDGSTNCFWNDDDHQHHNQPNHHDVDAVVRAMESSLWSPYLFAPLPPSAILSSSLTIANKVVQSTASAATAAASTKQTYHHHHHNHHRILISPSISAPPDMSSFSSPQPPPPPDQEELQRKANFTCNLGEVIDTLEHDVPLMFEQAPNMEIFTPDIELKDPKGSLSKGKRMYGAMFASLRVIGRIAGGGHLPDVRILSIKYNEEEQNVELRLSLSFGGSLLLGGPVTFDAVSIYKLNSKARVYEHCFDNVLKRHLWEYSTSWSGVVAAPSRSGCSLGIVAAATSGSASVDPVSVPVVGGCRAEMAGGSDDGVRNESGVYQKSGQRQRDSVNTNLAAEAYERILSLLPYSFRRS